MWRGLYRSVTGLGGPAIEFYLRRRLSRGKEDDARFAERHGIASVPRPPGRLFWMHAASNGEAMSALPLADRILARFEDTHLLLTTGTVTSARLVSARLPARAIHQFVPVDRRPWVRSFLDYWTPDAGIWVESEFWPNLIWEMQADGRPMALVNGRVSARSHARWKRAPGFARDLIGGFSVALGQTQAEADRLRELGARAPACVGSLKHAAPPLDADSTDLDALANAIRDRPVWLAASTHPGEEALVLDAHRGLARKRPDLLTILVPRHPIRGPEIETALKAAGVPTERRSLTGKPPGRDCAIYIADTLGELGLFYRLAGTVLVGGSLVGGHGGHNPVEPAHLDCALIFGPDMANFADMADALINLGAARRVDGPATLAREVAGFLDHAEIRDAAARSAKTYALEGETVADRVLERLLPILEAR